MLTPSKNQYSVSTDEPDGFIYIEGFLRYKTYILLFFVVKRISGV